MYFIVYFKYYFKKELLIKKDLQVCWFIRLLATYVWSFINMHHIISLIRLLGIQILPHCSIILLCMCTLQAFSRLSSYILHCINIIMCIYHILHSIHDMLRFLANWNSFELSPIHNHFTYSEFVLYSNTVCWFLSYLQIPKNRL